MRVAVFFFNDTATTEIYALSLHDALPISAGRLVVDVAVERPVGRAAGDVSEAGAQVQQAAQVFKLHALGRSRAPVCTAVINLCGMPPSADTIRLADRAGHVSATRLVVGVA